MRWTTCFLLIVHTYVTMSQQPKCPEYSTIQNFDVDRYLGLWYEIARYENFFELDGDCVTAEYDRDLLNKSVITVVNSMVMLDDREKRSARGHALLSYPNDPRGSGKLNVTIGVCNMQLSNYWILDTDYKNYAVVWSCMVFDQFAYEFAWILGRQRKLGTNDAKKKVESIVERHLNRTKLRYTEQDEDLCVLDEDANDDSNESGDSSEE